MATSMSQYNHDANAVETKQQRLDSMTERVIRLYPLISWLSSAQTSQSGATKVNKNR